MGTVPIPLFFSDLCYCEQRLSRDLRLQMKSATYEPSLTTALNSLPLSQLAVPVLREACGKTGRTDSSCQDALGPCFVLAADCSMAVGTSHVPSGMDPRLCWRWDGSKEFQPGAGSCRRACVEELGLELELDKLLQHWLRWV